MNDYNIVSQIYDSYNDANYDLEFYLQRYSTFKGRAVELMAGTGRISIPLLKAGVKLDCVDLSPELLTTLITKLKDYDLQSEIICANVIDVEFANKYDLAIIGFNSISEITKIKDQIRLLKNLRPAMNDTSEIVISIYNPVFRRKYINEERSILKEFKHEDFIVKFFISSRENQDNVVVVKQEYEFYDINNKFIKSLTMNINFLLQTKEQTESIIQETGFTIKNLYGDYNESPFDEKNSPFLIYILEPSSQ